MKYTFSNFYGALIGGAIGDALGAPIENMRFEQVMGFLGEEGVTSYIQFTPGIMDKIWMSLLVKDMKLITSKVK